MATCTFEGCERVRFRAQLCYGHWKYGDPALVADRQATDLEQIARIAIQAHQRGESMVLTVAAELGLREGTVRHYMTKARRAGHPIPYERADLVDQSEPIVPGEYELIAQREEWMQHGACRGVATTLFFPERGVDASEAKKVCATCPVKDECLDYALRTCQKIGIWGGTSEFERRAMRKEVRSERAAFFRELIA